MFVVDWAPLLYGPTSVRVVMSHVGIGKPATTEDDMASKGATMRIMLGMQDVP